METSIVSFNHVNAIIDDGLTMVDGMVEDDVPSDGSDCEDVDYHLTVLGGSSFQMGTPPLNGLPPLAGGGIPFASDVGAPSQMVTYDSSILKKASSDKSGNGASDGVHTFGMENATFRIRKKQADVGMNEMVDGMVVDDHSSEESNEEDEVAGMLDGVNGVKIGAADVVMTGDGGGIGKMVTCDSSLIESDVTAIAPPTVMSADHVCENGITGSTFSPTNPTIRSNISVLPSLMINNSGIVNYSPPNSSGYLIPKDQSDVCTLNKGERYFSLDGNVPDGSTCTKDLTLGLQKYSLSLSLIML
ncbi:hypothetical protein L2E82_10040 [Cichorium intybus]|uniref:Uncharacterized protein n=1 Tax=Cichorium intybus TaxID=13427 RepID=A0ACB9G9D0_CICIN|nr:hypothetical protein L2E82_10040 [Cichorium intybus]